MIGQPKGSQSSFAARLGRRSSAPSPHDATFPERLSQRLFFETPTYFAHVLASDSCRIGTDTSGQVTVMLHGDIYEPGSDPVALANEFAHHAWDFSRHINGSYALLVIDTRRDRIAVLTDRLNTRRVFSSDTADGALISSDLSLQPCDRFTLDTAGLAWYLSSGAIHANRTLFSGIRVLARSSVHELGPSGLASEPYWTYEFASRSRPEQRLSAELGERLVSAVRRRVVPGAKHFLSLSGGHDSSAICAILNFSLSVPDVTCLSYVLGEPAPGADEYVARQVAEKCQYTHLTLQSYGGSFQRHIIANALLSEGLCSPCDEVDAWLELEMLTADYRGSILFVGDECLGCSDSLLRSKADALRSVSLRPVGPWLGRLVPRHVFTAMKEAVAEDTAKIVDGYPSDNLHDLKDFLFLDQQIPNVYMPWRARFPGRFISVRNPLLDNDILDFTMQVPGALRRAKRLYCRTVERMFPEVFRIPRARRANYAIDVCAEVRREQASVHELIDATGSRLDEFVDPALIHGLLRQCAEDRQPRYMLTRAIRATGEAIVPFVRRFVPALSADAPGKGVLLRRLLVLRCALAAPKSLGAMIERLNRRVP